MHLPKSLLLLCLLLCGAGWLSAQEEEPTYFYRVIQLEDTEGKLKDVEHDIMLPYLQERVNAGDLIWHGFYRVRYPAAAEAGFDYVAVMLTDDFANLEPGRSDDADAILRKALPDANPALMWQRVEQHSDVLKSEVYMMHDMLFPVGQSATNSAAKYISVNYMDVKPGKAAAYREAESKTWKPIHAAHAKAGRLENWQLLSRIMPGGADFGPSHVTVDAFKSWGQIQQFNEEMMATAQQVHAGKDLEAMGDEISSLRTMPRSEIWELVYQTGPPATQEITVKVLKAGEGAKPMRGQHVKYNIITKDKDGKVLFDNQKVVGIPLETVMGDNPYDPVGSRVMSQLAAGGTAEVFLPVAKQNPQMRQNTGNQDQTVVFELLEVGQPARLGPRELMRRIREDGLMEAKAWHKATKAANPQNYIFPEWNMNALGYQLMDEGLHEAALYVLAHNQKSFPQSANAHDSLADAYAAMGNHVLAAKHYDRAVKMDPNFTLSKEKLKALRK